MTELLSAAQMRAIEQAAIDSGEVTGLELMERAGRGVVEAIFEEWPELAKSIHRAAVLCGPGNNGGDGFVVARLLKEHGWEVEVYLYGDAGKMPPDAMVNFKRWNGMGEVQKACGGDGDTRGKHHIDLMVDAVFGTGLERAVKDPCLWEWFWLIDDALDVYEFEVDGHGNGLPYTRTVAVDMPSGLSSDTGEVLGGVPEHGLRSPRVMLTVTFHGAKRGHGMGEGPDLCGKLVVADIGIGKWAAAGGLA